MWINYSRSNIDLNNFYLFYMVVQSKLILITTIREDVFREQVNLTKSLTCTLMGLLCFRLCDARKKPYIFRRFLMFFGGQGHHINLCGTFISTLSVGKVLRKHDLHGNTTRFYWSCISMEMKYATPRTPLLNEWNFIFKC